MNNEMILKQFIRAVIRCSYFERSFGPGKSIRVVKLDDVITFFNFYGVDLNCHISKQEVENILNGYFEELEGGKQ